MPWIGTGPNLLLNPTVEVDATGLSAGGGGSAVTTRSLTQAHSGVASARTVTSSPVDGQFGRFTTATGQGGQTARTYVGGMWVFGTGNLGLRVVAVYNSGFTNGVIVPFTGINGWQYVEGAIVATATASPLNWLGVDVVTIGAQALTWYMDDAMVRLGVFVDDSSILVPGSPHVGPLRAGRSIG